MRIQKIEARSILDSRKKLTVEVSVKTEKGSFTSSAPEGKSKGRFEAKPYAKSLQKDIEFLNNLKERELNRIKIEEFKGLKEIEGVTNENIGANSLFALESSILKALAVEQEKELWEFLSRGKIRKLPFPVGNVTGGGLHGKGFKKKSQIFKNF